MRKYRDAIDHSVARLLDELHRLPRSTIQTERRRDSIVVRATTPGLDAGRVEATIDGRRLTLFTRARIEPEPVEITRVLWSMCMPRGVRALARAKRHGETIEFEFPRTTPPSGTDALIG
ncbi:MAG: hypothetical protein AAGI17_05080 [Planctomycetota bacterium]